MKSNRIRCKNRTQTSANAGGKADRKTGGKARWGASGEGAETGSALYRQDSRAGKRTTTQLTLSTALHCAFPPKTAIQKEHQHDSAQLYSARTPKTGDPKGISTQFRTVLQRSSSETQPQQCTKQTRQPSQMTAWFVDCAARLISLRGPAAAERALAVLVSQHRQAC